MEVQSTLRFDAPAPAQRLVRVTSLEALTAIRKTLALREAAVFESLELCLARAGLRPPTAYELLRFMQGQGYGMSGPAFDLNSVRPRLTALKERGLVENGDKVICTITRKKAFTWLPSQQVREVQRTKVA